MKASTKLSVAFCAAAIFLVAVEIVAVGVVEKLSSTLESATFYNQQAGLVAEAIQSWREAPLRLNDHLAQFDDLKRLARTDEALKLVQGARADMQAEQPVGKIVGQLEELGAYYRNAAKESNQTLTTAHHWITIGLAITMFASILLFVVLTAFLRRWFLQPLQMLVNGATAVADGKVERKVSLIGGAEFADIAKAVNKMGDQLGQMRESTERNQRLATVGEACSHVTHNVRTLLGSIRSLAQYESNASDVDPNSRVGFNYIIALVNKLDTWVRDVHSTISPTNANRAAYNIQPIVHDIIQLLEPRISEKALNIVYQESEELPRCQLDRALFEQAFVAVLSNAIEASPDSGRIGVTLRNRKDEQVAVVIEDEGPGMNAETKQHVFDAFFTTKPERVGLGLTIAHTIVKNHGGEIELESEPGKGTRIAMFFPAAKKN